MKKKKKKKRSVAYTKDKSKAAANRALKRQGKFIGILKPGR